MRMKRKKNQLIETPMRIPNMWASWMFWRRGMDPG
jgi:hypothetical protein